MIECEIRDLSKKIRKLSEENSDIFDILFEILEMMEKLLMIVKQKEIKGDDAFVCSDPHTANNGHLLGAYVEGEEIKNILESVGYNVVLKRDRVNKDEFLSNLDKSIIHLAGHGGFDGSQVIFCFDDGDIYPTDISIQSYFPSLLLFASVCQGGYDNTMANVFIDNGTKYFVGFTDFIPDFDAMYFDSLVYEKWLVEGKDLETALDEADDEYPDLNCWVLWEK